MRKFFKWGKLKAMIVAGVSRKGHLYVYGGVKTKTGFHGGASFGTKGRQVYGGHSSKFRKMKFRHNLETKRTRLRIR